MSRACPKTKIAITKFGLISFLLIALLFGLNFLLNNQQKILAAGSGNTSGYAWGENVGWLSFNCDHTSLGLPIEGPPTNCAADGGVDYGVSVEDTELSGFAWGENTGWISLNCSNDSSCAIVDYKVTNDNGALDGFAWGENVGWINFNDSTTYKVETTWQGILGQLDPPDKVKHTDNPEDPLEIWWAWDTVLNATGYVILLWEDPFYNSVGTSNATSFVLSTLSDQITLLSANTNYTIKVQATDSTLTYTPSFFSNSASAYTSAITPVNPTGTVVSDTQIDWTWDSGGVLGVDESGFYAQIKEDPLINSGWQDAASWLSDGLSCGQSYILQVKAKNADFDDCVADHECEITPGIYDSQCIYDNCHGDETVTELP